MNTKKKVNPFGLIVALALPALCLMFAIPSMLSGNALFATKTIVQKPSDVIVYYEGEEYRYGPYDDEYDVLVNSAYEVIGEQAGLVEWGWSEDRFTQARSEGIAVELIYASPVKLPGSRVDIGDVYRLFIPLEVFGFSGGEVVFRGGTELYWGAPLRLQTLDPVWAAVNDVVASEVSEETLSN